MLNRSKSNGCTVTPGEFINFCIGQNRRESVPPDFSFSHKIGIFGRLSTPAPREFATRAVPETAPPNLNLTAESVLCLLI